MGLKMAPSLDSAVSSLLCAEDNETICFDDDDGDNDDGFKDFEGEFLGQNQGFVKNLETEHPVLDLPLQSDECLAVLIVKENEQYLGVFDYLSRLRNGEVDLVSRQEAVDWISKVHADFNFGPLSAYLAINYLDRFLAVYESPKGKPWMNQLLAVTCLSLAAKMEETEVPFILDLQAKGSRFLFEPKTIQRMELLVLSSLKWRMHPVTPFSFIDSFFDKVNGGQPTSRSFILKSTQLILTLARGIDFLEFKPSEVAAAVAVSLVGQTQTQLPAALLQYVQQERVLECVKVVGDAGRGCTLGLRSGTLASRSPIGVLEAATFSYETNESAVGSCLSSSPTKRRRLD